MSEIQKEADNFKPKGAFDIEYQNTTLENDKWAQERLRDIGKAIHKEEGLKYVGSLAAHVYISDVDKLSLKVDFGSVNQLALGDMPQNVAQITYQNLGIALAKSFGHKHRTRNTNDKR